MTEPTKVEEGNSSAKEENRSPELLTLEHKYRKLRETQPVNVKEPDNSGNSIKAFVDLSTDLAESYEPSESFKSAPLS